MHIRFIVCPAIALLRELAAALGDDPPALALYRSPLILVAWRITA